MELMTAKEVSNFLRMGLSRIYRIPASVLPYYRVGVKQGRRYNRSDVEAWLKARKVETELQNRADQFEFKHIQPQGVRRGTRTNAV